MVGHGARRHHGDRGLLLGERSRRRPGPRADRRPPVRAAQPAGRVQPSAADGTRYLESHSWDEYAAWHLGLTDGATEHTKGRYAFVYGDFRRLHRMGLIACQYRAAEWGHKDIELAAHDLLQYLDGSRA